jgi:CHASE3 domain sensor protein
MSVEISTADNFFHSTGSLNRRGRWTRMLPALVIGLIALMGISMVVDILFDRIQVSETAKIRSDIEQLRVFQAALIDAEDGVRGYAMSGRLEYLEPYLSSIRVLSSRSPSLLARLDQYAAGQPLANGDPTPVSHDLADLRAAWEASVRQVGQNQRTAAEETLLSANASGRMDRIRGYVPGYIDQLAAAAAEKTRWSDTEQSLLQILNVGFAVIAIIVMIYSFRSITRAITSGFAAKQQIERLFSMADMLQSAAGQEDTNEVLRTTAASLLPSFSGTLYVFNNSRDRLDLSTRWGELAMASADHITPTSCWALKRGKPHLNRVEEGALRCDHANLGQAILEIPMAARGQLYGLLEIIAESADAATRLNDI